jgi:chromosome segregation ATPase
VRPAPLRSIRQRPPPARRVVRSRTEAAAELIRLEHERDRLTQALAALEPRREQARERLKRIDERERQLLTMLEVTKADDSGFDDVIRPPR